MGHVKLAARAMVKKSAKSAKSKRSDPFCLLLLDACMLVNIMFPIHSTLARHCGFLNFVTFVVEHNVGI